MNKKIQIVVAAALVLMLGLGFATVWGQAGGGGGAAPAGSKVAVVDLDRVISSLKEKGKLDADLAEMQRELTTENQERSAKIEQMRQDLSMISGTQAKAAKQAELEQAVFEQQAWAQFQQQKLQRMPLINVQYLYRKMNSVVGEIAGGGGYDIALLSGPDMPEDLSNQQMVQQVIAMRKVLWHSDRVDITAAVITRMNNDFDAGRGGGGGE